MTPNDPDLNEMRGAGTVAEVFAFVVLALIGLIAGAAFAVWWLS